MASNETVLEDVQQGSDAKQKEKNDKVAEYLQAPRRKRKSFVIMAFGRATQDMATGVEAFVRQTFKGIALSQPRTVDEMRKNFARQIVLMVLDDEFVELEEGLELVREMRAKKGSVGIPVLFLTRQPERLVEAYSKLLPMYQELDEYLVYPKADMAHVYSKIRLGLMSSYRRRSRRYKIDMELRYLLLADDQMHQGHLLDLSVHGGLLRADDGRIFRLGEQLKLHMPVAEHLGPGAGEYLKISAKVRRVFIGGSQAGISFEHVSEQQHYLLTKFLTDIVNEQAARRSLAARTRGQRA